MTQQTI